MHEPYVDGGSLKEAFASRPPTWWAKCPDCRVAYLDDVPHSGPVVCPRCGMMMVRGLSRKQAFGEFPRLEPEGNARWP